MKKTVALAALFLAHCAPVEDLMPRDTRNGGNKS